MQMPREQRCKLFRKTPWPQKIAAMPMLIHKRFPRVLLAAFLLFSLLANPSAGNAHPMGNFSISHYSAIFVDNGYIEINYIVDVAEIPTYQEMQASHILAKRDDPLLAGYLSRKAASFADGLQVEVNGLPVRLELASQDAIFPAGAGGLPTMKLGFIYRAKISGVSASAPYTV